MKIINSGNDELKFSVKPLTGWFFATAQFIFGLCFVHIYTVPGSNKESIFIGLGSLGFSIFTFLTSFTSSIVFNKQQDRLTVLQSNPFWKDNQKFRISDIAEVTLDKYGSPKRGVYWEVIVNFNNGQKKVSLFTPSTDENKFKKIFRTILEFLD